MSSGKHPPHNIKNRVVIKGISDFLEFFQKPLQDPAFDGVRSHKVEDEAVLPLAVTMNAAHALFQAIGVPGNIIVKKRCCKPGD